MISNCYLCGASPATKPLELKDSFTAHAFAKYPQSKNLCNRCHYVIPLRLKYYNPNSKKEVLLFARNWSWLISKDENHPKIEGDRVSELPTRETIRRWLLNPPKPPFTVAIAESGQKHILFLSQEAHSREYFPVLFEVNLLYVDRSKFTQDLEIYEKLLALGLTKTEINTGEYKSQNLIKLSSNSLFFELEDKISGLRGNRLFELLGYVALAPSKESNLS